MNNRKHKANSTIEGEEYILKVLSYMYTNITSLLFRDAIRSYK